MWEGKLPGKIYFRESLGIGAFLEEPSVLGLGGHYSEVLHFSLYYLIIYKLFLEENLLIISLML